MVTFVNSDLDGRFQSALDWSWYRKVQSDGTYTWLDNGEGGAYAYDPTTGGISSLSGWFASGAPESTIFQRNSSTSAQVDSKWTGAYDWSCGANL